MNSIRIFIAISATFLFLSLAFVPVKQQKLVTLLSAPESKLIIDKQLIAFINKQAAIDVPDEVVLFADSIIVTELDTFRNFDLVLYTNYFKGKGLTIARSGLGKNGKDLVVFAKKIDEIDVRLPGNQGKPGAKGKNGKNGDPKKMENHFSAGTRGEPGLKGEKGGDGGNLTIHSLTSNYILRFSLKGGPGGPGGEGGQGGLTYSQPISKIINQGKPNQQIIYGAIQSKSEPKGAVGLPGDKGKDAIPSKNIVTKGKFDEMATKAYIDNWEKIAENGWRVIFRNKQIQ